MKKKHSVVNSLLMVTQIGISMLVPIFLSIWIGSFLDKKFGTEYWFLIFLFLGMAASVRNVYKLTKPFYAEDLKKEQKEQAYWDYLHANRNGKGSRK